MAGTVFRDATMNPQYPVRTPAGVAGRPSVSAGVDQQVPSRVWTTGANAAVHQPRAAITSSTRRPTITTGTAGEQLTDR